MKLKLVFGLALLANVGVSSQVTIGSGIAPRTGALLDLKQTEDHPEKRINSTKGLGMPRVELTDISNLYPMFEPNNDNSGYANADKGNEDMAHIGLLVYNVNIQDAPLCKDKLYDGMYVWQGKKWQALMSIDCDKTGEEKPEEIPKTGFVIGKSGTKYPTRIFGKAGEWITENLREVEYDYPVKSTKKLSPKQFKYPNDNQQVYKEHPEYGLLYTWSVAIDKSKTSQEKHKQGLCPAGWHIPSDEEWNELEQEIYENPERYSTELKLEHKKWNTRWGKDDNYRGNHGKNIKSSTMVGNKGNTNGVSLADGFNVLLVGYFPFNYPSINYGTESGFWSSTMESQDYPRYRLLSKGADGMLRQRIYAETHLSVRCKKD